MPPARHCHLPQQVTWDPRCLPLGGDGEVPGEQEISCSESPARLQKSQSSTVTKSPCSIRNQRGLLSSFFGLFGCVGARAPTTLERGSRLPLPVVHAEGTENHEHECSIRESSSDEIARPVRNSARPGSRGNLRPRMAHGRLGRRTQALQACSWRRVSHRCG